MRFIVYPLMLIALLGLFFSCDHPTMMFEVEGTPIEVEFSESAGGFLSPNTYLTVIRFADGRVRTFSTIVDGLVINKKCKIYKHWLAEWRRVEVSQ